MKPLPASLTTQKNKKLFLPDVFQQKPTQTHIQTNMYLFINSKSQMSENNR